MKIRICSLLISGSLAFGSASAPENDSPMYDIKLRATEISRTGKVTLQLINISSKPIKVWKDSNSWGAARWRLLLVRKGQLETFFQNPNEDFTVNYPAFVQIAGGAHIDQKLDLNGGNWCGLGHCGRYDERGFDGQKIALERGDLIVIVYDVPFFPESLSMGVWYGVAATSATVQ